MDYFDWYAAYLHRTCPVADGHRDLVTEVYRRRQNGETGILNKLYKTEFQKSGVNLIFASLFLGADELERCGENGIFPHGAIIKKAMEMLAAFYADLEETKGRVQLVTDKASLLRITAKKGLSRQYRVGVLLCLEGLDVLEGESELLRCFYAMGTRGASLTWNMREGLVNVFAAGCGKTINSSVTGENSASAADSIMAEAAPITDKGVQALHLMEQLGIFADSSHLSKKAAYLLPAFTKKAFAATHSGAAAIKEHERNLSDDEIMEIAARDGVVGVNAYREFNDCAMGGDTEDKTENDKLQKGSYGKTGILALCKQILYLLEVAGEDHVGFGLDFGEDTLITNYSELPAVTAELLRQGISVEVVKKILGGNWIRYLLKTM